MSAPKREASTREAALLPCPFCGKTDEGPWGVGIAATQSDDPEVNEGLPEGKRYWSVVCPGCGASCSLYCRTEAEAIAAWNRRIPSPDERPVPADGDLAEAVKWANDKGDWLAKQALSERDPKAEEAKHLRTLAACATRAPERERAAAEAMREAAAGAAASVVTRAQQKIDHEMSRRRSRDVRGPAGGFLEGADVDDDSAWSERNTALGIERAIRALPLPPAAEREEDGHG